MKLLHATEIDIDLLCPFTVSFLSFPPLKLIDLVHDPEISESQALSFARSFLLWELASKNRFFDFEKLIDNKRVQDSCFLA